MFVYFIFYFSSALLSSFIFARSVIKEGLCNRIQRVCPSLWMTFLGRRCAGLLERHCGQSGGDASYQQDRQNAVTRESECNQNAQHISAFPIPPLSFFSILVSPAIVSVRHPFWLRLMLDFLFGFASYNCLLLLWLRYSLCRQFRLSKFVKDITK